MTEGVRRLRAGDQDREQVIDALREHHAAGRLSAEEFSERMETAMSARWLDELPALLADLPYGTDGSDEHGFDSVRFGTRGARRQGPWDQTWSGSSRPPGPASGIPPWRFAQQRFGRGGLRGFPVPALIPLAVLLGAALVFSHGRALIPIAIVALVITLRRGGCSWPRRH